MIPIMITLTTRITNKNRIAKNRSNILALVSQGLLPDHLLSSSLPMLPLATLCFVSANFFPPSFSFTSGATSGTISGTISAFTSCTVRRETFLSRSFFSRPWHVTVTMKRMTVLSQSGKGSLTSWWNNLKVSIVTMSDNMLVAKVHIR